MAMNPDQFRLDEAEHQTIFEQRIKPDLFADVKPSTLPVAIIFGGQPGAGKSAAISTQSEKGAQLIDKSALEFKKGES
ncbi:MAG: zeta toxin family protein, partial [Rhodocyclaceae bacterium]|nr:zeta toxin family protein [Rhodocyclaceae bacterium]